jgi:hypothetical protein
MNLLERINIARKFCPVCDGGLHIDLFLKTFEHNSHQYTLINNSYPLEFKILYSLGEMPAIIHITNNNIIIMPNNIAEIKIVSTCDIHYSEVFCWSILHINVNEHRLMVCEVREDIIVGEFKISYEKNKTDIYKKDESYIYKQYNKLLSLPIKSISDWPLHDQTLLTEKINKLVLLK